MKAVVQIKYNNKIENVDQVAVNSTIYENLIDNLLNEETYELQDIYLTDEDLGLTFSEDDGKTVLKIVLELEQKLIADSYGHEIEIIEAVATELGKRYMEIIDITQPN